MKAGSNVRFVTLGAALVIALLSGCSRTDDGLSGPVPTSPEALIAELEAEKDRIDKRTDAMMERIEVFNASRAPGDRNVEFSELFYSDLAPEQRSILDELLAEEKRPSYKNLLTRIIEDRDRIKQMTDRIQYLEQRLPDNFVIVKAGQTHYDLAMEYLANEGVDAAKSRQLVDEMGLQEDLVPGFKVWFNYFKEEDKFKTYVTRGEAGQTPLAVARASKRNLIHERDVAVARATALEETKATLETDITRLMGDVHSLEDRKAELNIQVADLEARNQDLNEKGQKLSEDLSLTQNSMYYYANSQQALAEQGVLSRFMKNLKDVKGISYDESLDLRQSTSINLEAQPYGLTEIKDVAIWPEIYQAGRDYTVEVADDGQSARVEIIDKNMFKKQRVLIALSGKS
jgi:chromosome segregation ATPase